MHKRRHSICTQLLAECVCSSIVSLHYPALWRIVASVQPCCIASSHAQSPIYLKAVPVVCWSDFIAGAFTLRV